MSGEYDLIGNGYIFWKFIAMVRNANAVSWEIVPMRKYGNHVEYEQEQLIYTFPSGSSGLNLSVAQRVPPTSMRVNLHIHTSAVDDATSRLWVSPPRPTAPGNEDLQDTGWPTPTSPLSAVWKLWASSNSNALSSWDFANDAGWVETDDAQTVYGNYANSGPGTWECLLYVRGYEERTNDWMSRLTFP